MSLVLELQKCAMDPDQRVSDIVRKAIVVATKLKLPEFKSWCEHELNGYPDMDVPPYRRVRGEIQAWNPYRGWIPVLMEHAEAQVALSQRDISQPIAELEFIAHSKDKGSLSVPFPQRVIQSVFANSECYELGMVPTLRIGRSQVIAITQAVRNKVLEWSLALEGQGVLGAGLTFSPEEQKKAAAVTYNIGQFSGVLGNVTDSNIQVGSYNAIHSELKRLGVSQEERNELETIMDELPKATGESRVALLKRGSSWLVRNGDKIGALSDAIKSWFP